MSYWMNPSRYYLEWFFVNKKGMRKRGVRKLKFIQLKAMWHQLHKGR